MNMFDEARAISGMIGMRKMTQSEIAKMLGVSQSYVANKLRLLGFSETVREAILSAGLSERHARALLKLKGDEAILSAIRRIADMRLSVAASEALIDDMALDGMIDSVSEVGGAECVHRFEGVIDEAVKCLTSRGIRARRSIEFYGNKRYITVTIEEG